MPRTDGEELNGWQVDERGSSWLLTVGAELESAATLLKRSVPRPWRLSAAASILASTVIDVRSAGMGVATPVAPVFDDLADELESAYELIHSGECGDEDLVGATVAIERTSRLLRWAATELQIRALPEAPA